MPVIDINLSDAFHARTKTTGGSFELPLNPEEVAPFFGGVDRRDLGYLECKALAGNRRDGQFAALAQCNMGDVALIDLQCETKSIERCNLEEHLSAFDRGTQVLRQITAYDKAIERRHHLRTRKLLLDQGKLRLALRHLRTDHFRLGTIMRRHCLAILLDVLVALAAQFDALQNKVAVLELADDEPRLDRVSCPVRRLLDIAVEGSGNRALHRAFHG